MAIELPYSIGCPVWACDRWVGDWYPSSSRHTWLPAYSAVFNTVEGNSTFYGLPSLDTARRWCEQTADGFHFVPKFPRTISHDLQLRAAGEPTAQFLNVLSVLAEAKRLGPAFLQLPPSFGIAQLGDLAKYLRKLPRAFRYAVELRHFDYFDGGRGEQQVGELLTALGIDMVLFDSRCLFAQPPSDEYERASQHKKPRTPYRTTTTSNFPILRLVGRNQVTDSLQYLEQWATITADWINSGLHPYIFTHTPDDAYAAQMAIAFHERLRWRLPELPLISLPPPRVREVQPRLF